MVCARALKEKVIEAASHLMETAPADIEVAGGVIAVAGTDRRMTFRELAPRGLHRDGPAPAGGARADPPGGERGLRSLLGHDLARDPRGPGRGRPRDLRGPGAPLRGRGGLRAGDQPPRRGRAGARRGGPGDRGRAPRGGGARPGIGPAPHRELRRLPGPVGGGDPVDGGGAPGDPGREQRGRLPRDRRGGHHRGARPPSRTRSRTPSGSRSSSSPQPRSVSSGWSAASGRRRRLPASPVSRPEAGASNGEARRGQGRRGPNRTTLPVMASSRSPPPSAGAGSGPESRGSSRTAARWAHIPLR